MTPPRWSVWTRAFLPLGAALAFSLSPLPLAAHEGLAAARAAANSQQPASAAQAALRAAQALPGRTDLWQRAGEWWLEAGEAGQAVLAFEQAARVGQLTPAGQAALAEAYQSAGQLDQASQAWQRLVESGQADRAAYLRLAELQRAAGRWQAAGETLRAWLAGQPEDAEASYLAGLALALDAPAEGLSLLLDAARLDPAYSARVREIQGGLNRAGRQAEPAYGLVQLGRGYASAGEWAAARECFARSAALRPDYAESWALLGEARQQLGENGFSELSKAESLDPDSLLMHALFSLYWQRQDRPDRAVQHLEKILALQPENATWQVEVANVYAAMGRLEPALEHYQRAVELDPNSSFHWLSLAAFSVSYDYDIPGIGLPAARRAVALDPDSPAALDGLGQALLKSGDAVSAERFFKRALSSQADYAPALLHLGILYVQDGRLAEARAALQDAARFGQGIPAGAQAQHLLDVYFP